MNRIAYLLLAAALLAPLGRNAFGETMAERKQRIMRKYLRERQTIVQSDLIMPSTEEEERIAESEKFSQPQTDLTRRESSRPVPPPVMVPIPVQAQQSWWLTEEDANADPYADPFAQDKDKERSDSKADLWAQWKARQEQMAEEKDASATDAYGSPGDSGYSSGEQSGYNYSQRPDGSSRYSYGSTPQRTYGTQKSGQSGGLYPYGTTRYGSSPSSGLLLPPQSSQQTDGSADSTSGYTPYKSPYQTQREQQRQQGYSQGPQPQEFTKPTPYQKWKSDNKGWDPAADDAYLDELMRRNRR